jgi:glycosyltransferase involved in cell wall biosynthesis
MGSDTRWRNINVFGYEIGSDISTQGGHPLLSELQLKLIRSEAAVRRAAMLRDQGFDPDVIIGHPGWGETLFVKEIWPRARLGLYCEFFYHKEGQDVGFDPEFATFGDTISIGSRLRLKNASQILCFEDADRGMSPTQWQRSQYPDRIQQITDVVHDGIDTNLLRPDSSVSITVNSNLTLEHGDEIVTFVSRNLEPLRGYHVFMRALPEILKRRPNAHAFIVGASGHGYGIEPPNGSTWRSIFFDEVRANLDPKRVHFVGKLQYSDLVRLMQLSAAHVYLTYPFVLSWSLLEAMSIGCPIVASRTAPVEEVLVHGSNALLTDFFNIDGVVNSVCNLLEDRQYAHLLGNSAREFVVDKFDLSSRCLPAQIQWVQSLAANEYQ